MHLSAASGTSCATRHSGVGQLQLSTNWTIILAAVTDDREEHTAVDGDPGLHIQDMTQSKIARHECHSRRLLCHHRIFSASSRAFAVAAVGVPPCRYHHEVEV